MKGSPAPAGKSLPTRGGRSLGGGLPSNKDVEVRRGDDLDLSTFGSRLMVRLVACYSRWAVS